MVKCRVQEIAFKRFRSCVLNKSHYKVLRSLTDCISPWWSPRYVHKRGCGDRHQITPQMYQNIHSASHYYLILNGTLRSRNNDPTSRVKDEDNPNYLLKVIQLEFEIRFVFHLKPFLFLHYNMMLFIYQVAWLASRIYSFFKTFLSNWNK